jgi:MFS family permease
MTERKRRATIGWLGGSIAFTLAWFLFTRFVENRSTELSLRQAAIVGALWAIVMFVMMVWLPHRGKSAGKSDSPQS